MGLRGFREMAIGAYLESVCAHMGQSEVGDCRTETGVGGLVEIPLSRLSYISFLLM